ncbi:acrosomal protein KIAA1210 homolog [Eumetopias jubatus]|uniref:acrosomal protein KIAA1210 homolog n=1 Tax=Eumetopias jubatus TaxID=34886 RepID=UPI0010169E14|nr:acrosomal protein KIAA1210 homolog [Eumetopias jubatus]
MRCILMKSEGKKKSKFKAFKNLFGKRKKKELEDAPGGRRLKPSLSSGSINISSLKPVREGQRTEARARSSMGSKALSHDSIFMLDSEPEISVSRICPSPEPQRGRPLQRSQVSRTLPRSGTSNVHGAVSGLTFGAVPLHVPRSGMWTGDSKITELPSLCPRHSSYSPPLLRSDTISADFEEISVDEESPHKKTLPLKVVTLKSSFEPSPGPIHSQSLTPFAMIASPGSTQLPMSFNTPATTKDCLDSSAARHKMALNPQKQKKKKNPQTTGKAKQEEPTLLVVSGEEKSTTIPKEADKKMLKKDSAGWHIPTLIQKREVRSMHIFFFSLFLLGTGVSSLKQSKGTEISYKETADQAAGADAAGSQSSPLSGAHGRRRPPKGSSASGSSECAPSGSSLKQSIRGLGLAERAGSPPAEKPAGECLLWNLSLERQVREPPTTPQAERATPQELLPDQDDNGKRKAGADLDAGKGPVSQAVPEDTAESVVGGPSPCHEDGASGGEQPEARAARSSAAESLSPTPDDVLFSGAIEGQVFMDPSQMQSEGEEAFSFDVQVSHLKMASVQDIPAVCREKSPGNVLPAFAASISGPASAVAEGGRSAERLPSRSLAWAAEEASPDPEGASEEESGSGQQLLPRPSSQALGKPADDRQVFTESESSAARASGPELQLAAGYSPPAFGKRAAEAASADPASPLEEESGAPRQPAPTHPSQSLGKPDGDQETTDSKSSGDSGSSDERLTPTCAAQALQGPEDKGRTDPHGHVEKKHNSAGAWSGSEEDVPPRPPSQASGQPADHQHGASGAKHLPEEWGVSVGRLALTFSRPILQQQAASGSARPADPPRSSPAEPAPAWQPVQSWRSPQAEQQAPAGPVGAAVQWAIALEPPPPPPPRISSKRLLRPWPEPAVCKGPEMAAAVGVTSVDLPPPTPPPPPPPPRRPHSQPPLDPIAEQATREDPESPAVEGSISAELPPPHRPCQAVVRPVIEQQGCLGAEGAVVEKNAPGQPPPLPGYDAQPPTRPLVPPRASASPESPAASAEPLPLKVLAQASLRAGVEPNVSSGPEGAAAEKAISGEPPLPPDSAASLTNPKAPQASETAVGEGPSVEPPPRGPAQPSVRPKVQPQPCPLAAVGASAATAEPALGPALSPALGPAPAPGPASPRSVYQSWLSSSGEHEGSVSAQSAALEWGISLEPLPPPPPPPPLPPRKPSQNPRRQGGERAASWRSASAPPERDAPPAPGAPAAGAARKPPRCAFQSRGNTKVKQPVSEALERAEALRIMAMEQRHSLRRSSQALTAAVVKPPASAAPERAATEEDASAEPLPSRQPSQSPGRCKGQQMSSSCESARAEAAVSGKPVPSKYPTQVSSRSKVQEMSFRLENTAAEGDSAEKPPVPRHPSRSFVKFMAEQVFSEGPAHPPSANQLSKALLRSKVQYPASSGPGNASTRGGISSKLLPTARPLQPPGGPEGPRAVLPHSESAPAKPKQSSYKELLPPGHLSPAPVKLASRQVSSLLSQGSPEIQKRSKERLPSRGLPQAKEGAELQPQLFSPGPVSAPAGWSRSEECRPQQPGRTPQAPAKPERPPQVRPGSARAAAEGALSESRPGSWAPPRGLASLSKTKKHRQGPEDLIKNSLPPSTKPVKLSAAPTRQASTAGGTYSKGEGLESGDQSNSHANVSTGGSGVETLFGVRLRKVPSLKKHKSEKQDDLTKLSSLSLGPVSSSTCKEQRIGRSVSQGLLGTAENPATASDMLEKQQSRPKSESMAKKQPIYKVPGKVLGRQSDYAASEPAWITMVKQRQKSSQAYIPKKEAKTKNKAGAKPEAKEPRHGGEPGAGLASENQPRKTFTSDVNKPEKMAQKLPKWTKAVGFEDQKTAQVPTVAKETRQSSTLPAVLREPVEPEEPVWFSLAKKKAEAWSHIAKIMQ